jgi:hypothetical protein
MNDGSTTPANALMIVLRTNGLHYMQSSIYNLFFPLHDQLKIVFKILYKQKQKVWLERTFYLIKKLL